MTTSYEPRRYMFKSKIVLAHNDKYNNLGIKASGISMWFERWFLSSNAKDIGVLYLIFALFAGLVGTAFSVLIRLELSGPGVQFIADNQLYNSIITAHAIIMIFFMVKNYLILNSHFTFFREVNTGNNDSHLLSECNNNDNKPNNNRLDNNNYNKSDNNNKLDNNNDNKPDNKNDYNNKHNYVKVLIDDPYSNRDIILNVAKKQKGVYIWKTLDGKHLYVGHSINLYNRISSYFMPSILKTKARRVLRYLNKYGFANIKLTIYIMKENSSLEQVVELEQHFIDILKPNLNVDLVASNSTTEESITPLVIYNSNEEKLAIKENKGKSGVYRWVNTLTGDSYIGSAVDLSKRFSAYYSQKSIQEVLNRSKSNILSAIQKYGHSNFTLEILEYCSSSDTITREQYYLDFLYPEYNILSIASSSLGKLHCEETKLKISSSLKGKYVSEQTKQKMSESRTGKIFSDETKKILSDLRTGKSSPFLNKSHTEETKQKMSEAIGSKVKVFNKETNQTTIFSSNYKVAESLGCSDFTVRYHIKNKKLYKGKYFFEKNDGTATPEVSQEMREKLRKLKGTPVYMYNAEDLTLLYIFESKQQVYSLINIHHVTLNDGLNSGNLYLNTFFFSLDIIEESPETSLLPLDQMKSLVSDKKEKYKVKHPAAKSILGEFKDDTKKNIEFDSLNSLAKHLKGDRQVIRQYLKGEKSGYYRGKWKFTYKI